MKPIERIHRKKDYFWLDNALIKEFGGLLGPVCISIYACLAKHSDQKTQTSFPSQKTIAREIGTTERTVRNHIGKLIQYNIIRSSRKKRDGEKWTKHIYLLCDHTTWIKQSEKSSDGNHRNIFPDETEKNGPLYGKEVPTNNTPDNNMILAKEKCAEVIRSLKSAVVNLNCLPNRNYH